MKKLIQYACALALAVMTLGSCEDVPMPYNGNYNGNGTTPETTTDPIGEGTLASPYNVAKALQIIKAGTYTSAKVYLKGIVAKMGEVSTQYGNATYFLADTKGGTTQLEVYRGYALNGAKFATGNEIAVGDTLVVYGVLTMYNATPEVTQGSQIVSINGKGNNSGGGGTGGTAAPAGEGTEASPYNVAKAQQLITAGTYTSDNVYVAGTVVGTPEISTEYGNATYYISDDGTEAGKLEVYRGYALGGEKFTATDQLKAGDKVVVLGALINYNGTHEIAKQNKIVELNGKKASSTGDTPNPPTGGTVVTIDGTTVTATAPNVTAGNTTVTIDLNTLGLANAADVGTVTLPDGSTLTFAAGTNTAAPKFYTATKGVRVYANNTITFACKAKIAKIVFTCDTYNGTNYVGNDTGTVKFDGTNATYTNTFSTDKGGVQLRVQTITITYAQ